MWAASEGFVQSLTDLAGVMAAHEAVIRGAVQVPYREAEMPRRQVHALALARRLADPRLEKRILQFLHSGYRLPPPPEGGVDVLAFARLVSATVQERTGIVINLDA